MSPDHIVSSYLATWAHRGWFWIEGSGFIQVGDFQAIVQGLEFTFQEIFPS